MKNLFSILFLLFAFTYTARSVHSQGFPYHLYDTRTMAELVELNSGVKKLEAGGTKQIVVSANPFYSAVRLEYAGESRKLSKEKIGLFRIWMESLNVKSSNTGSSLLDLLDKEFLFKECGKEYWIPVQIPAANDFPKDMKKGDRITLYLMMVGGIEDKGKWDFIFFTNSFKIYE